MARGQLFLGGVWTEAMTINFVDLFKDPQTETLQEAGEFCLDERNLNEDIGLGEFRLIHLYGAMYVVTSYASFHHQKMWHPILEKFMPNDPDVMSKQTMYRLAAKAWFAWGVLTESAANLGEHLIRFAVQYIGYRQQLDAVCALPYMSENWFITSSFEVQKHDHIHNAYQEWVNQLKEEYEGAKAISVTESAKKDLENRKIRYERALNRTMGWFTEWLDETIRHQPESHERQVHKYNTFQQIFLLNMLNFHFVQDDSEEELISHPVNKKRRMED